MLLAPAILALGLWSRTGGEQGTVRTPVPWFASGFLALVLLGGTGRIPESLVDGSRVAVPEP